jgi:hypothetical protein
MIYEPVYLRFFQARFKQLTAVKLNGSQNISSKSAGKLKQTDKKHHKSMTLLMQ